MPTYNIPCLEDHLITYSTGNLDFATNSRSSTGNSAYGISYTFLQGYGILSDDGKGSVSTLIARSFLRFDTSIIPDNEIVTLAQVKVTANSTTNYGTVGFSKWTSPDTPFNSTTMFSQVEHNLISDAIYVPSGGGLIDRPLTFTLTDLSVINKTGNSGICFRSTNDIAGVYGSYSAVSLYSKNYSATPQYQPFMEITTSIATSPSGVTSLFVVGMDF